MGRWRGIWRRVRTFGTVKGKPGEVTAIIDKSLFITAQGGQIEVAKLKHEDGKKIGAADFVTAHGLAVGSTFGT